MKYSFEILKISTNVTLSFEEKSAQVKVLIEKALNEFNVTLFFIEDILNEVISKVV